MRELNFNEERSYMKKKKGFSRFGTGESGTLIGSWNQKSQQSPPVIRLSGFRTPWERDSPGKSTLSLPVGNPDDFELE